MDKKSTLVGLLIFVVVSFNVLFIYNIKHRHKIEKEEVKNWKWDDKWGGESSSKDDAKSEKIIDEVDKDDTTIDQKLVADTFSEAVEMSGESGKPVLAFFTANWCTWCARMKSETMSDAKVKNMLKNYIFVYVDSDTNQELIRKFGVSGLPSYMITNVNQDKLKFDNGFMDSTNFTKWLDNSDMFKQPKNEKEDAPKKQQKRKISEHKNQ